MAQKRKKPSSQSADAPVFAYSNDRGGVVGHIITYEDVADEEDAFHMQRDRVMLDEGTEAKRRRRIAEDDAQFEASDEEILAYSDEDEEDELEQDAAEEGSEGKFGDEDAENEGEEEEEEGWGKSKSDYYSADAITTEADALEEEAEAKRLQKKRLQKMSAADFGFDEDEWRNDKPRDEEGEDTVVEVLKDIEITADMPVKERERLLMLRYPELEVLARELVGLTPILAELQQQVAAESSLKTELLSSSIALVKARALAAYISSLSMYFAILTSPIRDDGQSKCMDPAELRDHSVMDSILQCRTLWSKVKDLQESVIPQASMSPSPEPLDSEIVPVQNGTQPKKSKKQRALDTAARQAAALRVSRMAAAEASLADLSSLAPKTKRPKKSQPIVFRDEEDNSDFGEEETLSASAAAEKAARKKSLRFYTSQIAQKANKRADAGRNAGGDDDVPYKERIRDRQARLNAEAEKRGKKLDEYGRGADLGGESGDEEADVARKMRGNEDEYYDLVAQTASKRKLEKAAQLAALKQSSAADALDRITDPALTADKRAIGYTIEKNKGLAPKRKKEVRNPRVKKRMKFEEKKRKLGSMKAVYKGGEERGGYGGEKTGIKTGLVKSIKL